MKKVRNVNKVLYVERGETQIFVDVHGLCYAYHLVIFS